MTDVQEHQQGNYLRDPYREWVAEQGVPAIEEFSVDMLALETAPWARLGANAAFVKLKGGGDELCLCVEELPPGGSTEPQRHLYEEVVYVLSGRGSTQVIRPDGRSHTFEWGPKSLFALPMNARYRHFNASGREPARLACTISLPLLLSIFRDEDFVFGCDQDFPDRFGADKLFEGEGDLVPAPLSRTMWETNFVSDLAAFDRLIEWKSRGAGGRNVIFVMADGTMHAHISEMPVGTYKKAHRHGPDYLVFAVTGHGYSLLWYDGDEDLLRVDWRHGVVYSPPDLMFHQHFNTSPEPVRYLATAFGSARYPFSSRQRFAFVNVERRYQDGGMQIEYEDQDPRIHHLYVEELAKNGVELRMSDFPVRT